MLLPGSIAHHRHRCGAGPVVRGRNRAPGKCADTERREVVAGNELSFKWLRGLVRPAAAHAQFGQATLKCGQLAELRRVIAELLVERNKCPSCSAVPRARSNCRPAPGGTALWGSSPAGT